MAWVSLEERDNDPTRFWSYLVAAVRTVEPGVGTVALEALGGPSVELERVVVPSLVNDLAAVSGPLVLVLDDYHLITDATCHQTLGLFLDHLPAEGPCGAIDPGLTRRSPWPGCGPGGSWPSCGSASCTSPARRPRPCSNDSMGLHLAAEDVARLAERTEGWAAGLVLAGL